MQLPSLALSFAGLSWIELLTPRHTIGSRLSLRRTPSQKHDTLGPADYTFETKHFTSRYHAKFGRFSRREITRDTGVATRGSADGGRKFRFCPRFVPRSVCHRLRGGLDAALGESASQYGRTAALRPLSRRNSANFGVFSSRFRPP